LGSPPDNLSALIPIIAKYKYIFTWLCKHCPDTIAALCDLPGDKHRPIIAKYEYIFTWLRKHCPSTIAALCDLRTDKHKPDKKEVKFF
jgi:NADH:ubiquinone oxidoreductase subunit E